MLVELDTLMVTLLGAVDASARFMHIQLGLPERTAVRPVGGTTAGVGMWPRETWI